MTRIKDLRNKFFRHCCSCEIIWKLHCLGPYHFFSFFFFPWCEGNGGQEIQLYQKGFHKTYHRSSIEVTGQSRSQTIQITVLSQTLSFMVHRNSGPNKQQLWHCSIFKNLSKFRGVNFLTLGMVKSCLRQSRSFGVTDAITVSMRSKH